MAGFLISSSCVGCGPGGGRSAAGRKSLYTLARVLYLTDSLINECVKQ
jgi:hypothetical protein